MVRSLEHSARPGFDIASPESIVQTLPAVVAYNRFAGDVNRLATRFESFMEEFSNILQRQVH